MIPPTFIFDETQEVIASRANRDRVAESLLAFLGIGALMAVLYVLVTPVLAAALPDLPGWLVGASVYVGLLGLAYLLHRAFAFHSDLPHAETLSRYVAVQLAVLGVAALFSLLAYGVVGVSHLTSVLLVVALTAGVNFTILDKWAFAPR